MAAIIDVPGCTDATSVHIEYADVDATTALHYHEEPCKQEEYYDDADEIRDYWYDLSNSYLPPKYQMPYLICRKYPVVTAMSRRQIKKHKRKRRIQRGKL